MYLSKMFLLLRHSCTADAERFSSRLKRENGKKKEKGFPSELQEKRTHLKEQEQSILHGIAKGGQSKGGNV